MLIQETFVDRDQNAIVGESDPYESYTDNVGRLFRACQREHGRCISKMFVDGPEEPKQVGWVFEKRQQYAAVQRLPGHLPGRDLGHAVRKL